ncbi:zinc transporter ZntB [Marivita sp. S2033]|uniref:zinc transporter ZntB n=1 Tax=Marivita sp. S2033 TaxID=3373187 RepID=UPI003982C7E6
MKPENHSFSYAISDTGRALVEGNGAYRWTHVQGDLGFVAETLGELPLDPVVRAALSAAETRPRCTPHGDGAVVILRGVNLIEGADPEDMISLRIWIEANQIVSVGIRPLGALDDIRAMVMHDRAPATSGAMLAAIALRLIDRADPVVADLNEALDGIEDGLQDCDIAETRAAISDTRQVAIALRRYLFPQRDALTTLEVEAFVWITDIAKAHLREAVDRLSRLCEELDMIRERCQVVQDHMLDVRAEAMNQQMLVLTVVAAFFLPISFLTGLLGVNVGGVPLAQSDYGFWIVCALMLAVVGLEFVIFRKFKLF